MSNDRDAVLAAAMRAINGDSDGSPPSEPEPPESEFARQLRGAIAEAVLVMRTNGMLVVDNDEIESLIAEVAEAGLDTKSAKHLVNRVIKTLLESDHVEEIYGTDDELRRAFRQLLGE